MLTLITELHSAYFIEANTNAYRTMLCSVMPLADLDDLFAAYCCIDFISEI